VLRPIAPYVALTLFSVAFGIEEAIIVVYLRRFGAFTANDYRLESSRELCTLVAIGAVAWLCGTSAAQRAKAFCFTFGAWDIVYYLGLWILSGYPSITDHDVLFLVPVPWLAPVWAPMAFAFVLMAIGVLGVARQRSVLLALGFLLALFSFVYEAVFKTDAYPIWLFVLSFALVLSAIPGESLTWSSKRGSLAG
jgi:hypothetical protein